MTDWKLIEEYRTNNECRYYGSDLNKFIAEKCTHKMIVNNIDCIIYKYGQNKLRIIESKHCEEKSSPSQQAILQMLAKAKQTVDNSGEIVNIEVYMLIGDVPYNNSIIRRLNDDVVVFDVCQKDLISFLNFELDFNNLVGIQTQKPTLPRNRFDIDTRLRSGV